MICRIMFFCENVILRTHQKIALKIVCNFFVTPLNLVLASLNSILSVPYFPSYGCTSSLLPFHLLCVFQLYFHLIYFVLLLLTQDLSLIFFRLSLCVLLLLFRAVEFSLFFLFSFSSTLW